MDFKAISELLKDMSDSKLSFLEVETEGIKITMKKEYGAPVQVIAKVPELPVNYEVPVPQAAVLNEAVMSSAVTTAPKADILEPAQSKATENLYIIKSPIVGTFYKAAGPDSEPFAKVGSKISKGDTLCIIEAMKLMNDIESDVDGEVVEIYCSNEQLVEYDQPLFGIRINQ